MLPDEQLIVTDVGQATMDSARDPPGRVAERAGQTADAAASAFKVEKFDAVRWHSC